MDTAYPDPGHELNNGAKEKTVNPEGCQSLCKTNPQCQLWTWGRNGGECWLKKERSLTKKKEEKSLVSGTRKACPREYLELCHMSHFACHMSHCACHMSYVKCLC